MAKEVNQRNTRRNPEMEKYVTIEPFGVRGPGNDFNVFLKVGNQSFCVTPHGSETKEEAEWMRDMLCIALANLVKDFTTNEKD